MDAALVGSILGFGILGLALIAMFLDLVGCFGPSDGAIDAYYRLKETDPKKARKFLKTLTK